MGRQQDSSAARPSERVACCEVRLDRPRDDGDWICGLPAAGKADDMLLCAGHHRLAMQRAVLVERANASAQKWLEERGVSRAGKSTADYIRELSESRESILRYKPGFRDWALRIMSRHADGEVLPPLVLANAREAMEIMDDGS